MAQESIMVVFKAVIILQLFFSFAITGLSYYIPEDAKPYVTTFSDVGSNINMTATGAQVSEGLQKQTNIPVLDLGALVFYSGNILLDLILNFAFALPEMIGLLVYGLSRMIILPAYMILLVESFSAVVVLALYFISVIQLLTGLRSGRVV